MIRTQFGPWLPDLGSYNNPGCIEACNVIPESNFYRGLNSLVSTTSAVVPNPETGFWAERSNGDKFTFIGTDNGLFRLDTSDGTWDDVSNGDMSSARNWRFTQFGEHVIAVAAGFAPQYYDLSGVPASTTFQNLAGSPPTAQDVAVVRDFVVLAQPDGERQRVQWSGFNNDEIWGSIVNQADFQELRGRIGTVQRIVPGEYGLIICEHSILRMDYVGPPLIFQFSEVSRNRGTRAPDSVVTTGGLTFFYGHAGFFMTDGRTVQPIGHNRIDDFFLSDVDASDIINIRGAVDRVNKLVFWIYRSGSQTFYDRCIIYNWASGTWARAEFNCLGIFQNIDPGYNLDTIDTIFTNGIDIDSFNVDTNTLSGGSLQLAAFDTSRRLASFSGAALPAVFETGEMLSEGKKHVSGCRPEIAGTGITHTVSVGHRNLLSDAVVFTPPATPNAVTGVANFTISNRYIRFRVTTTGAIDQAYGAVSVFREAGRK